MFLPLKVPVQQVIETTTPATTSTTMTTTTTTAKPTPCELNKKPVAKPEIKKDDERSSEISDDKVKSTRRRRDANFLPMPKPKMCLHDLFKTDPTLYRSKLNLPTFNSPLFGSPILGSAAPEAVSTSSDPVVGAPQPDLLEDEEDQSQRYEQQNLQLPVSSVPDDSHAEESVAAANPEAAEIPHDELLATTHQVSCDDDVAHAKRSLFTGKNGLSFLQRLKSENLLHGNPTASLESVETLQKASIDEADSSQSESTVQQRIDTDPVLAAPIPYNNPADYLPSFEYFPKNPSNFYNSYPSQSYSSQYQPTQVREKDIVIGPSAFISNPVYNPENPPIAEIPVEKLNQIDALKVQVQKNLKDLAPAKAVAAPQGCRCDPEQFNQLLHHMQASYGQFQNSMSQLFEAFRSQANCAGKTSDSSVSPSHSSFDYKTQCADKNYVNADPVLYGLCANAFAEAKVNPSSGYYEPPGINIKTGGFQDQFLSYADYVRMMENVNANSGTLISNSDDFYQQYQPASRPKSSAAIAKDIKTYASLLPDEVPAFEEVPESTSTNKPFLDLKGTKLNQLAGKIFGIPSN